MKHVFSLWLLLVVTISCVLGVVYWVVQQDMRIGANDSQIQMAEDTASALQSNKQITFSQENIDISQSVAPFIMTFDANGNLRSSEAVLNGKAPVVPSGIFSFAKSNGEDRLTWQPEKGVRIAAVVVPYTNGFVLAGRNIREVEKREDQLLRQIIFGWLATVGITFVAAYILLSHRSRIL